MQGALLLWHRLRCCFHRDLWFHTYLRIVRYCLSYMVGLPNSCPFMSSDLLPDNADLEGLKLFALRALYTLPCLRFCINEGATGTLPSRHSCNCVHILRDALVLWIRVSYGIRGSDAERLLMWAFIFKDVHKLMNWKTRYNLSRLKSVWRRSG